jgi:cytoskeletal protein RodZ
MSVTPPEPPAEPSAEPPSEPPKRQGSAWTKAAVGAAVVALAVVLFVLLRPDDDEEADSTPAAQTTTEATTEETTSEEATTEDATTEEETTEETTTEEEPTTEENPNAAQRIVVTVRDGQPVGGVQRPEVERNAEVLLIVRADVEDEAHLHGYDLAADVGPGQAARIRFQAETEGVFELELEDRALLIAELEVH